MHSFVPAPCGSHPRVAYACDLGTDTISAYDVSAGGGLAIRGVTPVTPGSGPRHLVQHPTKPEFVYVVSEMGQTVTVYRQAGERLELLQNASLLPSGSSRTGGKAAELVLLPPTAGRGATR